MTQLFQLLLITHVAAGAASLILFWIPVTVRKGSKVHIRSGHWYARCMYLVAISSLLLCAIVINDPIGIKHSDENLSVSQAYEIATQRRSSALFLFSIGILVIANIRHGLLTLGEKSSRLRTRSVSHTMLNIGLGALAFVLAYVAYRQSSVLFYVFAGLCGATATGNLRYAWRQEVDRSARIRSHLASMIAAGIASHTAFFVFGANRFLGEMLSGPWQLVPWIAPGLIGGVIITILSRRYVVKPLNARKA